jgi:2-dehydro-3-deoxyphosphogluconate aldolase/(4S)-4-hydroxy-2-oxoglutarate aldolase
MARTKQQAFQQIAAAGVVAVIRAPNAEILPDIAKALLAGGVPAIEVTMTTPGAIAGIEMLAKKLGNSAVIGVGTVLDAATARDAISAGAAFVVSPAFDPSVVEETKKSGRICIPGAFTPTEILRAWNAGADVVKVFPATALGPGYFKDVLAPLPQIKLTPTGGVDVTNAADWIKAGAVFIGAGSALVSKEAMSKRDWEAITRNAKAFVQAIKDARQA